MSSFFTRLVERTQGVAKVAQPIIPPMFAPASNTLSDYSQDLTLDSEPLNAPNRVMVTTSPNDSSSEALNQPFRKTSDTRFTPTRHIESDLSEQVEVVIPQVINDQNENSIIEHSSSPTSHKDLTNSKQQMENSFGSNESSTNKRIIESDQNTSLLPEHPIGSKRDVSGGRLIDSDQLNLPRNLLGEERDQNIGTPLKHLLNEKRDASGEPIYFDKTSALRKITESTEVQPAEASYLKPPSLDKIHFQQAAKLSPSSAEPTIKVTIGRIEVRAIMPSVSTAPAPRARSQSPILSLNDYIKQRNEGRR